MIAVSKATEVMCGGKETKGEFVGVPPKTEPPSAENTNREELFVI